MVIESESSISFFQTQESPSYLYKNTRLLSSSAVTMWNMSAGSAYRGFLISAFRSTGYKKNSIGGNPTVNAYDRLADLFSDVDETELDSVLTKGCFAIPFQNTIWGDIMCNNAARATR